MTSVAEARVLPEPAHQLRELRRLAGVSGESVGSGA
jgi:hypothetical protein